MILRNSPARRGGFTLVEMLVVLGIIAVLAALLLPAAMGAVTRARDAAIGLEINQIASAVEAYRQEKGDYPPNFRDTNVFIQHLRKCYPKMSPDEFKKIIMVDPMTGSLVLDPTTGKPRFQGPNFPLDDGEALVFWLSGTTTDPRYPFGLSNPAAVTLTPKRYYEFDDGRLFDLVDSSTDPDTVPSYRAKYCKDSCYIYIDSRSYHSLAANFGIPPVTNQVLFAYAEDYLDGSNDERRVRPYWSDTRVSSTPASAAVKDENKPMNATTFQLICAGQDGDFGMRVTAEPPEVADEDVKLFPSGSFFSNGDKDNITNFSQGKRLEASAGKTR